MRCRESAATRRRVCAIFDGQQLRDCPRERAELARAPPMDKARSTHVQHIGGLSLARHQLLAVHAVSLPYPRINSRRSNKLSPQGGAQAATHRSGAIFMIQARHRPYT
jgi:hypothetical protein